MSQLEPKIYVACLAAYNSGRLHGEWIDANQDAASLEQAVQKIISTSPVWNAEEWAIHDLEDFGAVRLSDESLENISEIAVFIAEHGELGAALVDDFNNDVESAKQTLEEDYYGAYANEEEFARNFFCEIIGEFGNEGVSTLENLMIYIDFEKYARDLFTNDFFYLKVRYTFHVFRNT